MVHSNCTSRGIGHRVLKTWLYFCAVSLLVAGLTGATVLAAFSTALSVVAAGAFMLAAAGLFLLGLMV